MKAHPKHQLVVRHGTVVVGDGCTEIADISIDSGVISGIGGHPLGERIIDAEGLLVTPGGIDTHVHLTPLSSDDTFERPDDFISGSRAALKGGITTIGNMTHQHKGEGLFPTLEAVRSEAEQNSLVDFILHPVLNDPNADALSDIGDLRRRGYSSLKLFMVFDQFDHLVDAYVEAMAKAATSDILVLIHCEDRAIIRFMQVRLTSMGEQTVRNYAVSRPQISEIVAVERAMALAEVSGAKMHIVHLCSAEALHRCELGRERGVEVYVETRPLYLHLTDKVFAREDAAKFVGNPPPRSPQNRERLWNALVSGEIHTVASDHAPWTLRQKLESGTDIRRALPGVAELETMLPMLFSEGVASGRMGLERFVEVTSTVPARLYGLAGIKGAIQPGYDADLVIWDPNKTWRIEGSVMESRAGYSPYEGWKVHGSPIFTIRRGEVLRDPDGLIEPQMGRGRLATELRTDRPAG